MTHGKWRTLLWLVSFATNSRAGGIGAGCRSSTECMETNYNSYCHYWLTIDSCPNGICRCKEGYEGIHCDRSLTIQGYDQICNSTFVCGDELYCDRTSGRCVCATSTYIYKEATNLCLASDSRVVGETCNDTPDCYNWSGADGGIECNGASSRTCQCVAGCVQTNGLCYKPHAGQSCNTEVGCERMTHPEVVIYDESRVSEQCISGVCECPPGSDIIYMDIMGAPLMYCIKKSAGELKSTGETCTTSSQCSSKACIRCPGSAQTTKRCIAIPSRAREGKPPTTIVMVAIAALGLASTFAD